MKKKLAFLLALVMCLSLCACGKKEPSVVYPNIEIKDVTNEKDETVIELDEPIILVDNEYIKFVVVSKFEAKDMVWGHQVGYKVEIENKMPNHYVNLVFVNCSVDGYMTDLNDGPVLASDTLGPAKKNKTTLFFPIAQVKGVDVKSIDDLVNFDGSIQLGFSEDGEWYGDFENIPFENIVP